MKTGLFTTAFLVLSSPVFADPVVATSVRQGNTVVTTTARGVYTTQIQPTGPKTATSETRFQPHDPQSFAARNTYKPMSH